MKTLKTIWCLVLIICVTCTVFSGHLYSQEEKRTAKVLSIMGAAEVRPAGEKKWIPAEVGMVLNEGDVVKTGADAWILLNLNGTGETATVELSQRSQLLLSELRVDEERKMQKTLLDLGIGEILIKAKKLHSPVSKFEVKTPTSVVGVRGTKFSVKVEALE